MKYENVIWKDRKRNFLGLPWTFTVYTLVKERLLIERGLLNSREDEVRLYRITDLTLTRNLWQKIIGTGTIHCDSADQTMKNFDISNIRNAQEVKEQLSELVDQARKANRVYARENLSGAGMPGPDGMHEVPGDGDFGERAGGPEPEIDPDDMAENH